jgi:predicted transcriptional regulator
MGNLSRRVSLKQECLETLMMVPLKQVEARVLWHLVSVLPADGGVLAHVDIADAVGVFASHVSVAMKRLIEIGFVVCEGKEGVRYRYRLREGWFEVDNRAIERDDPECAL